MRSPPAPHLLPVVSRAFPLTCYLEPVSQPYRLNHHSTPGVLALFLGSRPELFPGEGNDHLQGPIYIYIYIYMYIYIYIGIYLYTHTSLSILGPGWIELYILVIIKP